MSRREDLPKLKFLPWSQAAAAIRTEPAIAMLYASIGGVAVALSFIVLRVVLRAPDEPLIVIFGPAFFAFLFAAGPLFVVFVVAAHFHRSKKN